MRIAILGSRGIPANYGGFETFAEEVSAGLVALGHAVTVYCPSYQGYRDATYRGVRLQRIICLDDQFRSRFLRASTNLLYDIFSLIHVAFSRADIVYMLGYASGPALVIPRLTGKTMVVNPDGLEWKSKRWGLFARSWLYLCEWVAARTTSGLIADAEPIRQHFIDRFGVNPVTIPYGAFIPDADVTASGDEGRDAYLAVARMVPETSIPLMIRGFLQSRTTRVCNIIGPVPDSVFFESEVMPLVDGTRVRYLGPIYDRAVLTRYRANAFALLHGHASDGTNPSLLESMAAASPIIAVRTTSNADVVGDNDDLYFSDEAGLASCIDRLETYDEGGLKAMKVRNRTTIETRFSWNRCVEAHLAAFAAFKSRTGMQS